MRGLIFARKRTSICNLLKLLLFFRDFMLHDWSDLRFEWSEALRLVTLATCANLSNILNVG